MSDPKPSTSSGATSGGRGRGAQVLAMLRQRQQAQATGREVQPQEEPEQFQEQGASTAPPVPTTPAAATAPTPKADPVPEMSSLSLADRPVISRQGAGGRNKKVLVNFVRLEGREDGSAGFFHHSVTFSPSVDVRDLRFRLLGQHREMFPTRVFDGSRIILPTKVKEGQVKLSSVAPDDGQEYELTITFERELPPTDPAVQTVINGVFRQIMREMEIANLPKGLQKGLYYDVKSKHTLPKHKLEIWPGYEIRAEVFEGGLLLQIDSATRVMRTETVHDILATCMKKGDRDEAIRAIVGSSAITRYNNKSYKIDDIAFDASPSDTFEMGGKPMTFAEYYKKRYGILIKDEKQPLLVSFQKQINQPKDTPPMEIRLVPELCFLAGMTDAQRQDFRCMKDVAEFTRLPPDTRLQVMGALLKRISESKSAVQKLDNWGIKIVDKPMEVEARVLDQSTLLFGGGYTEKAGEDWARAAGTKLMMQPRQLEKWSVLFPEKEGRAVKAFCETLSRIGSAMGIKVAQPKVVALPNDRAESYLKALREVPEGTDITMTVFPGGQRADRYAAVKKLCYLEQGMSNQCILTKTLSNERRLQAVAQKVLLQMATKLGGEPWGTKIPIPGLMTVGVDVYRNKGGAKGNVTAVVSSLNQTFSKYHSKVFFEKESAGQTDFPEQLASVIGDAAKAYRQMNGGAPTKILVYRDGVSAGQLYSFEREGKAVVRAIEELWHNESLSEEEGGRPKVWYCVVQKKIATRIVEAMGSKVMNPPAGLILDHTVTQRHWYDFFLVPMAVTLGTVTPVQMVVVTHPEDDEALLPAKVVQRLTYALTHLYFNWPGNVKVPAPCQYAHKLVEMTGEHLHKAAHQDLQGKLFYL